MSPTQRTMDFLRARGWLVGITEKFVRFPPPGHRQDLFGCVDLIAIRGDTSVYIQTCAGASHATRLAKVKANPNLSKLLEHYSREVWVWSWRKAGERGKRKTWQPRIESIWHNLETVEVNPEHL